MDHLLEIRNLSIELPQGRRKPPVKLVEGVDLTVRKKQNFGVVGESGCGKSITCSSIMGLLSFPLSLGQGSSIRFQQGDGREVEITVLSKAELRKLRGRDISMIFQEPMTALDPMYTIEEQICESLLFHASLSKAEMHDAALEMLRKVKIPRPEQILKDYPHHLSGGMLQRVMIAIALINNPRLLIADEPTTALDVTIQAKILELIRRIQKERGISVIYITHDLGVVAKVADYVDVMYAGKIVETGTIDEIFYDPKHPYTWGLLSAMPDLDTADDRLYTIPGSPPNLLHEKPGDAFAPRNRFALNIDDEIDPPMFKISDTHYAATWLLDPRAPKVEMPPELKERIARMKAEAKKIEEAE